MKTEIIIYLIKTYKISQPSMRLQVMAREGFLHKGGKEVATGTTLGEQGAFDTLELTHSQVSGYSPIHREFLQSKARRGILTLLCPVMKVIRYCLQIISSLEISNSSRLY